MIPRTHGQQIHGLFLDLLRKVDPALSAVLHNDTGRKPFGLSPLVGLPAARDNQHHIAIGTMVALRLTILDDTVFGRFLGALLGEGAPREVRLGQMCFAVQQVATAPDLHAWAGIAEPHHILEGALTHRTATLQYTTPTAFSLGTRPGAGKVIEPFPRADLVFGGLLSTWNAFSGIPFEPSLRQIIAERIVPARFRLRSAAYQFRDHLQVGTIGTCTYDIKGPLPDIHLRRINALADAARFLGVGYRTTMGMGQARRLAAGAPDDPA